ncbi:hypothetical protein [Limosilactobacillus fermentum]|uniref:Uncharacterized protein n=1 Tax=Limosilactobacillus fermentum TaxID=1613 RepID=A0AAJ5ZU89_LIMFE|nr:hypothetical protein [Limosilactobacillus fermentum]UVF13882.1 hypothetical protein NHG87_001365 [Limosilactobacillus fermentum]UVW04477.1 hypothetical protein NX839_05490 [Limosilactobacillus fermentum]WEN05097.1 hypothetical protein P0M30_08235 [Limosilactobacillus fermentum]WEN11951.1 hypothetical protein P0N62_08245 [Limosilactobacillus fermentum]WFR88948.1 hypothetical protein P8634_09330 [Limosilactobacillus fermentum]
MADWKRIRKRLRENLMDLLQIFASEDDYVRNGRKATAHKVWGR